VDNSGQERTQDVGCNRRSLDLQLPDLRRGRQARWSSSLPTQLPRALRALARVAVSHRGRASLSGRARNPRRHVRTIVILAGVPPTCHKQRSRAVASGQSRSLRDGRCAGRWPLTWTVGTARNCMACKGSTLDRPCRAGQPAGGMRSRWMILARRLCGMSTQDLLRQLIGRQNRRWRCVAGGSSSCKEANGGCRRRRCSGPRQEAPCA
jgi:hypothetical protein